LIAKFNVCVRDFRAQCVRHVTISLIDSSYGYLCNEGYNKSLISKRLPANMIASGLKASEELGKYISVAAFMESAECLMELDRKPAVKRALNFFAACVKSPIKHECGFSAWQSPIKHECGFSAWQGLYKVLKDTTNTLMPGCHFTGSSGRLHSAEHEETSTKQLITVTSRTSPPPPPPPPPPTTTPLILVEEIIYAPTVPFEPSSARKAMRKNVVSQELAQLNSSARLTFCFLLFIVML
ncbi:hypothetical protein OESDEN_14389, partial [Oesophagostomum dentatum]